MMTCLLKRTLEPSARARHNCHQCHCMRLVFSKSTLITLLFLLFILTMASMRSNLLKDEEPALTDQRLDAKLRLMSVQHVQYISLPQ